MKKQMNFIRWLKLAQINLCVLVVIKLMGEKDKMGKYIKKLASEIKNLKKSGLIELNKALKDTELVVCNVDDIKEI